MNRFSRWLPRWFSSSTRPDTPGDPNPAVDLIEKARVLAREGQVHEASHAYSRIPRKHATVEVCLEHADLMLAMGDRFGAASNATRVLDREPANPRALAIRRTVLALDDADRKKAGSS
jgi:hypothetical protein